MNLQCFRCCVVVVLITTDTFMHLCIFVGLVNESNCSVHCHGLFKTVSNIMYAGSFLLFIRAHVC